MVPRGTCAHGGCVAVASQYQSLCCDVPTNGGNSGTAAVSELRWIRLYRPADEYCCIHVPCTRSSSDLSNIQGLGVCSHAVPWLVYRRHCSHCLNHFTLAIVRTLLIMQSLFRCVPVKLSEFRSSPWAK